MDKDFATDLMLADQGFKIEFDPEVANGEDLPKSEDGDILLPILPVRNTVLFPGVVIPITVGKQRSIKLIRDAYESDRMIGVITQHPSADSDEPSLSDVYPVGTVAKLVKLLTLPDGSTTIIIQGREKFSIKELVTDTPYWKAKLNIVSDDFPKKQDKETKALLSSIRDTAQRILKLNPEIPQEAHVALENIENPSFLIHFLSSNLNADVEEKQQLLEMENGMNRAGKLLEIMLREVQLLEIKHEIQSKASTDIDQQQRDYFLRQQMKVLQDELGVDGPEAEIAELHQKAANKKWPEHAQSQFEKELDKVSRMNPAAPDYSISIGYCEFLVDLPWDHYSDDKIDLMEAQKILDKDHFGLDKVKDRIVEFLAVLKLKNNMKGPILCLAGPPGVGKTSLGKSIAKSMGREYTRMSLGGLHDESELRGHRKTYIGAMAGRILQNIKKTGVSNPVFILDEIDKIGNDFRGDPASALLEILDPEQNSAFVDNYLETEYDLSKVLFVATANSLDTIHPALRDRMEIIHISGYTQEEKYEIAKRHLVPKQRKEHGLKSKDISFTSKSIKELIDSYTRESGVRKLEQTIASVVRNVAKDVAMEIEYAKSVNTERIEKALGKPVYDGEIYEDNETSGVVTGLAWTSVGGEILFIESSLNRGKGKLTLSGQLGDVMKESASAALSYLKAHAEKLGIEYQWFDQYDLHIHVPAGAVPKDGPSAGITMLTSIASSFTQRKIKKKLAMTGEITLRGKVLPVGGIKEKILAAKRAGIKEIILCYKNEKDIIDIDDSYLKGLKFHYVTMVDEVLEIALLDEKIKGSFDLHIPKAETK